MSGTLLDELHARFVEADTIDDSATRLSRFVDFCKQQLSEKKVVAIRYNNVGQACLVFEDGSMSALGNPLPVMGGAPASYAFTQQPRAFTAPATLEGWSVPLTGVDPNERK